MELRRRIRGEDGIALIVSLIVLSLLIVIGATVIGFSSANSRDSARSRTRIQAHGNAEGGIAAGLSRIYKAVDSPNLSTGYTALNPTILPSSKSAAQAEAGQPVQYDNGYAYYWGTLNGLTGQWTVYSEAHEKNPNAGGADIVRNITAKMSVNTVSSTGTSTDAWNWIYARHEGYACDMVIQNPGDVVTNIWVEGNLCVENTARLMGNQADTVIGPTVVVEGNMTLRNPQNEVGSTSQPVNIGIGTWCKYRNQAAHDPCQGPTPNPNEDHVYSTGSTDLEVMLGTLTEPTWPTANWNDAYINASPGPYYPCAQVSGTPPVFDNDAGSIAAPNPAKMNGSAGTVLLTPNTAYTCKTTAGELSWTPGNPGKLNVRGTIFIDGNAEILNNTKVDYDGTAAIYVQGDLLMQKAIVCAVFNATNTGCDNAPWNPNAEFLLFVVSAQVFVGDEDIEIKSTLFQGGLMAANDIVVETTSQMAGPMLGDYLFVGQTAGTAFPFINLVPTGTPGEELLITQASAPKIYG